MQVENEYYSQKNHGPYSLYVSQGISIRKAAGRLQTVSRCTRVVANLIQTRPMRLCLQPCFQAPTNPWKRILERVWKTWFKPMDPNNLSCRASKWINKGRLVPVLEKPARHIRVDKGKSLCNFFHRRYVHPCTRLQIRTGINPAQRVQADSHTVGPLWHAGVISWGL